MCKRYKDTSLSEYSPATVECAHETNDNIKLQTVLSVCVSVYLTVGLTMSTTICMTHLARPTVFWGVVLPTIPQLSTSWTYILRAVSSVASWQFVNDSLMQFPLSISKNHKNRNSSYTLKMKVICKSHAASSHRDREAINQNLMQVGRNRDR